MMLSRFCLVLALLPVAPLAVAGGNLVDVRPTPGGHLQPELRRDAVGVLHLLTFSGEPASGDLYHRVLDGDDWSAPERVNSRPGTAIAIGTVRGGHLATGSGGVHVGWMSADREDPGMFYARSDGAGGFEPQRNVSQEHTHLDGGGSLAVDEAGRVHVAWHAGLDEPTRRLFVATSTDSGRTFAAERRVNPVDAGACGCCGMRAGAAESGMLWILYRAATEQVHRDMQLLSSSDGGASFTQANVGPWEIAACPMSTAAIAPTGDGVLLAWETDGQIHWMGPQDTAPREVEGETGTRKHPAIARDATGRVAVVWTEGAGWNRGGDLAWRIYDAAGQSLTTGRREKAVDAWDRPAVVARPGGGFLIVH